MRRVRSQFLGSVVRLLPVVWGRGVSGGAVPSFEGTGASSAGLSLRGLWIGGVLALVVGVALPAGAVADPLANFGSFGNTPNGPGAGQLSFARGLAVNQSGNGTPAGSVYVAESNPNHRISQFNADGGFVRMWGWDVVSSGPGNDVVGTPNEFEIRVPANGDVCKAGVAGAAAGQLANPTAIAIDQSNGFLYVTSQTNRRIDVFSGTGEFAGAFGWDVDPAGAAAPEICTTATTCKIAGTAGADAGRLSGFTLMSVPAVDPSVPGRVYVPDAGNLRVSHYDTTITAGTLTAASFVKAFGWDVDPAGGAGLESCTATCKVGVTGGGAGQFSTGSPSSVTVDGDGAIYAVSAPATCAPTTPCRIQRFAPDASSATDFGPISDPGQVTYTTGLSNAAAALTLAVDPDDDHVFVLRRESTSTYRVIELDSSGVYVETHPAGTALPAPTINSGPGLAIGINGRVYANMGIGAGGQIFILGPVDPAIATIEPVVTAGTTATLHGTVEIPAPGAPTFTTKYHFEYSNNGIDWVSVPVPDENVGDSSTGVHQVSQLVTGLEPGTLYSVRLTATTGSTVTSDIATFTTDNVEPRVALTYVQEVTQTEAQLGAHIDPEGLPTSYRFEWGDAPCSANPCTEVPVSGRDLGDGSSVVVAKEDLFGLSAATSYHYRVVATSFCHPINASDTTPPTVPCVTEGPDQVFETLNSCGLTDNRCYEMVSPTDKGPVGAGGDVAILGNPLQFQAAPEGQRIAYNMAYGDSDATAGSEVLYQASRGLSNWSSFQLSAPALDVPAAVSSSDPSTPLALASDLSCGLYASTQRLAADAPQETLDAGASLLYRRNADGSWTTITSIPALNPDPIEPTTDYQVIGMSDQPGNRCERVVFRTKYRYPGVDGAGSYRTYEWNDGVLSDLGKIPGPGGEVDAEIVPGAFSTFNEGHNYAGAVTKDASRVFFQAVRQTSPKPAEVVGGPVGGKRGVFVRDSGATTIDVSLSQTAVPNDGHSRYETASGDGQHVFFTARYGLAVNGDTDGPTVCGIELATPNGAGCDLYRYSVADGTLMSVTGENSNPAGAGVAGIIDVSENGSHVYFAASGQLVPGKGNSQEKNIADSTYSIYLAAGGTLRFVGTLDGAVEFALGNTRTGLRNSLWTSKVTADGSRLLFPSSGDVPGESVEAFLYDANTNQAICVSCRRDRQPSAAPNPFPLPTNGDLQNRNTPPVTLTADGRRVFFFSANRLASGATEGQPNLYQWEDGQVSFLANSSSNTTSFSLRYAGASADGDDVYFTTVDHYTWEDIDGKLDVYAARVGGGFPEPPAPPAPCDPLAAAGCEGPGSGESEPGPVETSKPGDGDLAAEPRAVFAVGGLTRGQRARLAAGRRVAVSVRVSRPGAISVRGTATIAGLRAAVLSGSLQASGAGRYRVPVSLSRAAVKRLRRAGSLRVALSVRFSGAAKGTTRQIALRKTRVSKRTANNDRRASR